MWLPLKVRHLVLINQRPLLLSSTLCFLLNYFLCCLFLERNLHVPGITLNWKQTHSSYQNPGMKRHLSGLCLRRERQKKNTLFMLLIVEECLSKLWWYQAQSVAREGVTFAHGKAWICWRSEVHLRLRRSFLPPKPSAPGQSVNPGRPAVGNSSLTGLYVLQI